MLPLAEVQTAGVNFFQEYLFLYSKTNPRKRFALWGSVDTCILKIPCSSAKICGQRLFSQVGPSTWNGPPYSLHNSQA